jgi:hypothetical protein
MTCLTRLVAAWGNGQFGRLGHGSQSSELFPRVIPHLAASSVSAGGAHTAVITGTLRFGDPAARYVIEISCQPGSRDPDHMLLCWTCLQQMMGDCGRLA